MGPPARSIVFTAGQEATLEELYRSGRTFDAFYAAATARRALWVENTAKAAVPEALLNRARAIPTRIYILAIAIDACSDSVNSIPYVAKLAEQVDAVDMRIIGKDAGQSLMESHRTPDGRAATPTLIFLNERFEEVGCWVERPLALQAWYEENSGKFESSQLVEQKMEWYRNDGGQAILREVVEIMEAASAGQRTCAAGTA
jgi:hypothetical protein